MGTEQGHASSAARVPCGCSAFENGTLNTGVALDQCTLGHRAGTRFDCGSCSMWMQCTIVSDVFSSGGARRVGIVPNGSGLHVVVGKRDVRARVRTKAENRDDLHEN